MLISYHWLQDYLGKDLPTPEELAELLAAHAFEVDDIKVVGDDTVLDVDVLPDRSSDCLSHYGLALELAAILDQPLVFDPLASDPQLDTVDTISVSIEDVQACPRFTAQLLKNVTVGPSPAWLQARLQAMGQRPINTVVDATNYVMYALGQPLHAYDAQKFATPDGAWQFGVRTALAGETVDLLGEGESGAERNLELAGSELLITEATSDTPIGLAGVKGGRYAEVDTNTTDIIIEAAHFDPVLTRQTARRHNIVIDASKRFENEPARILPAYAQVMIAKLLADIAGATSAGWIDVFSEQKLPPQVDVRPERVDRLLGLELSVDTIVDYMRRLRVRVVNADDVLQCTGPANRTDLNIEEDFIEEIGRLHGYANVPAVVPEPRPISEVSKLHYYTERIRVRLLELGCSEVITSSFRKKDEIRLKNALASDKGCLRSALSNNIHTALDRNAPHVDLLGVDDIRLFEIGTVFTRQESGLSEHTALAIGVRVRPSGYSGKEDKILEVLTAAVAEIIGPAQWQTEKGVAECNLSELLEQLPEPTAYEPVASRQSVTYRPYSVYPSVSRDIALWVNEGTTSEAVEEVLRENAGSLCVRIRLFDEFSKDGRISFAFRLVFQASDRTLVDQEITDVMNAVYERVAEKGWEVR